MTDARYNFALAHPYHEGYDVTSLVEEGTQC